MLRLLRSKAGYGLIEVIISMCVLSTMTIASMTLLNNMMASLEFFRGNVVAQTLAMSKVNQLSVAKYADVASEARAQVDLIYKLDREVTVNEVDLGGGSKEKQIAINVYKTGASDTLFTLNYTLSAAGSGAAAVSHGKQRFTSSGTYTVPEGVTTVWLTMCGGGGAGGVVYIYGSSCCYGAGGGGGSAILDEPVTVTPGESISITVGTGGTTGAGGASSFGAYKTCAGGGLGGTASTSIGGAAGGAGGQKGANGDYYYSYDTTQTFIGYGSGFGGGTLLGPPTPQNTAGSLYGSGGGGSTTYTRYAGAKGVVIVEW